MAELPAGFDAHLRSGLTTLCRAWEVIRKDGQVLGFTDHDLLLSFKGLTFAPNSGMSASTLAQATGLSVDNAEAVGALSDASITEADIAAGRYDGAEVICWMVNWQNPDERWLQFRGHIGEVRSGGGAFTAELRGLTDQLNRPQGRVFQKPCTAVLGDGACKFNTSATGFFFETQVHSVSEGRAFTWPELAGFAPDWFARGRLDVTSGAAAGLWSAIKTDTVTNGTRLVELWEPLRAEVQPGDTVRLTAGCDKRWTTCRDKFANLLNFQGFPDLPGEDWMLAVPKKAGVNSGGSRR